MPDMVTLSLAKKYALKMNNVGVQGAVSDESGITWTLKDGTQLSMSINGWHNLTTDEQLVLSKFVPVSNDGGATYFGTDLNRYPIDQSQTNNNKPYSFTSSMWIQDIVNTTKYTLTILHNLGDLDIIPFVKNSNGKAETVGIDTSITNKVILESTIPFDGKLILNYSSSNGNKINSICTVNSSYIFTSNTLRDTYFQSSLSSLKNGLLCMVNDGTTKSLYTWEGLDYPSSYNNSLWNNSTALIKGETGLQGDKINHKWTDTTLQLENVDGSWDSGIDLLGKSAYQSAVDKQSFSGTETEWLESLNSCLGKFSSLADLKIAYPVGIDKYKFAIIETITGQVGIAFYETGAWDVTVFASTNGSSVVKDDKSISVNSMGNMELFGYDEANINTIPCKYSDGTIKYLVIEKDSTNAFTSIASKEFVNEAIVGGLSIQNDYYDASTNTPNITTINTSNKSYAWIVSVAGTQTLGGNSETFAKNDLVIKTNNGGYLKIHNASVNWGSIIGDINQQTDLINLLATYCKIDDADTISTTKTYSIKHILSLLNGHRKIFMQSDSPIGMVVNDMWCDTTNIPYTFSAYDGSVWRPIGKSAGTIINDWVGSVEYKSGEYSIHNNLLYKCTTTNTDSVFTPNNWNLISGHIIKGNNGTYFTKRSNLEFSGNGVSVTDDSTNDSTIITINGEVTLAGTQILTNKTIDASSNTISNLSTTNFVSGIIDTDGTLTTNSDSKIPSQKAVKTYADTKIQKVSAPTANDIAIINTDGTISDGGILKTDIVTKTGTQTIQNKTYADSTDGTKQFAYDASGVTTGTKRTLKIPDSSGTLGLDLIGSKTTLANQTANVTLSTSIIDSYEYVICNQTSAGVTITLPNPTTTTNIRRLIFVNTGSVSVVVNNTTVGTGSFSTFVWNGSSWSAKESVIKDNLNATTDPTPQADSSVGYSVGSIWINTSTSITWTCIDVTIGGAKWISSANTLYFDNWSILVADLTNPTISHTGKYIVLNNANGGNVSGTTYKSTDILTTTITDGGSATYYVSQDYYSTSSAFYTVTCQNRTASSSQLVISGVYTSSTTATTLVTSFGSTNTFYAIWTSVASADSSIITKNAIMKYNGSTWSVYQSFDNAPETVMVGSTGNWNPWCKIGSTWTNYGINTTTLGYMSRTGVSQSVSTSSPIMFANTNISQNSSKISYSSGIFTISSGMSIELQGYSGQPITSTTGGIFRYAWFISTNSGSTWTQVGTEAVMVSQSANWSDMDSSSGTALYSYTTTTQTLFKLVPTIATNITSVGTGSGTSTGFPYAVIKEIPTATYVPANASIPTSLNYLAVYNNTSTTLSTKQIIPFTGVTYSSGSGITYDTTNKVFYVSKTGTYKLTANFLQTGAGYCPYAFWNCSSTGTLNTLLTNDIGYTSGATSYSDKGLVTYATINAGTYITLADTLSSTSSSFAFTMCYGSASIEELPIATYIPANALTPTTLNWMKLGGNASYTTVANSAIVLPQTSKQGEDLTYNSLTGVTSIGKTSNYKIMYKAGSTATANINFIYLQSSTDGSTWTTIYSCNPEAPSAGNTYYSPQDILWEGNLSSGTYFRFYSVASITQGASGDVTTYPSAYIEEIPSATVIQPNTIPVNEWTTYTPTITCPSTTFHLVNTYTMKGLYRIVGKNMQLKFIYSHTNNTGFNEGSGSNPYQISIPSGYTIDTTKANIPSLLTSTTGNGAGIDSLPLGSSTYFSGTTPICFPGKVVPLSTTTLGIHNISMGTANPPFTLWGCGNSFYGASIVELTFEVNIPIL